MSGVDEPVLHDWLGFARELAEAGWWADAVTAYEQALAALPGGTVAASTHGWQVELLGGFTVRRSGVVVDLAALRPQHRALLQVLCLFADEVVSDQRLCGWFWPDAAPDRARHRLAVGISALRATGMSSVERATGGYRMRLGGGDTDVRRFGRRLILARSTTGPARTRRLEEALAAWSGPLLPLSGDAEWVLGERDRLCDAAVDVAAELAQRYARDGRHHEVVRVSRAGLRIDRHADRLWRCLVAALAALGEPAAAATARREYRDVLADLGVVSPRSTPAGRVPA